MAKKKKFFGIDFDGTIVTNKFPDIGDLKSKAVAFIKKASDKGHVIIIWTCRSGNYLKQMKEFLDKNNVPYKYINENPEFDTGSPKIYADVYVDDKALNISDIEELIDRL